MRLKNKSLIIILFIAFLSLFICINTHADIYDDANLLSENEFDELSSLCKEYSAKTNKDIVVYSFRGQYKSTDYSYEQLDKFIDRDLENWVSKTFTSKEDLKKERVIFAIDMNSRTFVVMAFDGANFIDFRNNDKIVYDLTNFMKNADYYGAYKFFIEEIGFIVDDMIFEVKLGIFLRSLLISAIGCGIICFVLVFKTKGKKETSFRTYLTNKSRIVNQEDIYIRTDIKKTRHQSSSSGGSGGGGGGSRGGGGGHGHF